ncbi:MAG: Fic family protein [Deltaproteobacteria bacterium]|nr:Fic family protein [Deltaproteobacteria bacterium]
MSEKLPKKVNIIAWEPRYTLTAFIARQLMDIEAAKAVVEHTPLSPVAAAELRHKARVRSSHYSTQIEGNRLTLGEAKKVIENKPVRFHGRERDVSEVRNYWTALLRIEEWAVKEMELTEIMINRLHSIVMKGPHSKPSDYRDGQNVIRDSASGAMVYLPPQAHDVSGLMKAMVAWARKAERENLPVPLIAALVHYQFVTIHPYYDGNGRTARLLATFILHRGGYGLNGFFSLEEHHARDLETYYRLLATHPHHNYYEGRADADLTAWLTYFSKILAEVFAAAEKETKKYQKKKGLVEPAGLRKLDPRARVVLGLFAKQEIVTTNQVAKVLCLSERSARLLLNAWVSEALLVVANPSNRKRAYKLSVKYRQYFG